jgi:hypothetical protein
MSNIATILPLAVVMIAGPQIITSFFLATSESWKANSFAYVLGAAISISAFVSLSFLVFNNVHGSLGEKHTTNTAHTADYVILGLIAVLMIVVFLRRGQTEPPKWMSKLQTAKPRTALVLGLALLGLFPTDILTTVTVGLHLAHHSGHLLQAIPYIALTLLLLALPSLAVLAFGERGQRALPKIRDWMGTNSWIVSEAVLLLFLGLTLKSIL